MRTTIEAIVVIAALVLGYGYWHMHTHGSLLVYLTDKANDKNTNRAYNARLAFFDANGQLLARAKSDDKYGVVWPEHPAAGYCGPALSGEAYQQCFKAHSTWLMDWAPHVRKAEVQTEKCHIRDIPVTVRNYPDNIFMWWIPLPHVGGVPRSNYSFDITIDSRECRFVAR
jgi:hypothetical protein